MLIRVLKLRKIPKDRKRFTRNPEAILILKSRHSYLAVHGWQELLGELEGVPINEQAPLPLQNHLRLLLVDAASVTQKHLVSGARRICSNLQV